MKKLLASIAVFSTLASPVLAQETNDTAGSAVQGSVEIRSQIPDAVAIMPAGISEGNEMTVAAAVASPFPLSLNDEQLEKIAKLKADFSDSAAGKLAQLHTLNRQLRDSLTQEHVDKAQVMDVQTKINNLKNDLSNARLNMHIDTLALLSPEQKQKLRHASLQRQVFGKSKAFRGHHGSKHGAPAAPTAAPPA